MMKKMTALVLAMLLLFGTAMAEMTVVDSRVLPRSVSLCGETNCYVTRTDSGYQLFDAQGNALSDSYRSMTVRLNGLYLEVQNVSNAETLNCLGLLNAQGQEILPLAYGDFEFIGNDWVLAYVLEPAAENAGEYKDAQGNLYIVGRTDVVYGGQRIGSLSRDQYIKAYSVSAHGPYLSVKCAAGHAYWIDSSFGITDKTVDGYISVTEYDGFASNGVLHNATQQYAFTPGCTLSEDEVEQHVWHDSRNKRLLDLQGNVLASDVAYDYAYFRQSHFVVKDAARLCGIMNFDGSLLVDCEYKDIAHYNERLFASGYNAAITPEGKLHFLDTNGNVTASVDYELTASDYKGYTYNAPIIAVKNMNKYIIITATHGELSEKYDDISAAHTRQSIIAVKKGDAWGCIDMAGNTVIPFEMRNAPSISADGTLVHCRTTGGEYRLYRLEASAPAVAADRLTSVVQSGEDVDDTPVLAPGAWQCACGFITNGNFCPGCGSARPAEEAPADDGSWDCACGAHNTSRFCPECGSAKPEAPAAEPQCSGCGYKPEGDAPKFCPECGTKF